MGGGFESGQCSRALFVHFQRLWGKGIGYDRLKNREGRKTYSSYTVMYRMWWLIIEKFRLGQDMNIMSSI